MIVDGDLQSTIDTTGTPLNVEIQVKRGSDSRISVMLLSHLDTYYLLLRGIH